MSTGGDAGRSGSERGVGRGEAVVTAVGVEVAGGVAGLTCLGELEEVLGRGEDDEAERGRGDEEEEEERGRGVVVEVAPASAVAGRVVCSATGAVEGGESCLGVRGVCALGVVGFVVWLLSVLLSLLGEILRGDEAARGVLGLDEGVVEGGVVIVAAVASPGTGAVSGVVFVAVSLSSASAVFAWDSVGVSVAVAVAVAGVECTADVVVETPIVVDGRGGGGAGTNNVLGAAGAGDVCGRAAAEVAAAVVAAGTDEGAVVSTSSSSSSSGGTGVPEIMASHFRLPLAIPKKTRAWSIMRRSSSSVASLKKCLKHCTALWWLPVHV